MGVVHFRRYVYTQPLLLLLFLTFSVLVADSKTLLYTVANPAHGLLNREKRTNKKSLAAYPVWGTRLSMLDWVRVAGLSCTRGV